MDRSPTSRNPVVLLPLPYHGGNDFDRIILEHPISFSRQRLQTSPSNPASSQSSLAQVDVPPSSVYRMTGMPNPHQSDPQYAHHSPSHGVPSSLNILPNGTQPAATPSSLLVGTSSGSGSPMCTPYGKNSCNNIQCEFLGRFYVFVEL